MTIVHTDIDSGDTNEVKMQQELSLAGHSSGSVFNRILSCGKRCQCTSLNRNTVQGRLRLRALAVASNGCFEIG